MSTPHISNRQLVEFAKTYWHWRWLWIASTLGCAMLGLFYVLFLKSDIWIASQGLIVRDEANGSVVRLGRFESQTEMKAAQETVLEMARNTQVLQQALLVVGRSPKWFGFVHDQQPPTSSEIDALARGGIEIRAPRGAELGTTEVIYLDVRDESPQRAAKLNSAVCDALELQLKSVRQARAEGVIAELTTARDAARYALAEATNQLQLVEAEAGADLSDLRGLTDANTGGSATRLELETIKSELRRVELELHQLNIDLGLAKESFEDPDHLLLTPSRLVANQPGLRKLREGLADAKITTSGLKGRFTEANATVIVAMQTEDRIREQLREELGLAIETLLKDIEVTDQQRAKLREQQALLDSRLSKLAEIRAEYSNIASAVRARNQELQDIERELGQVVASRDSASTSSLLTRVDQPIIGERPIGPGRSTILLGATVSGLMFGLGVVFLLTPLDGYIRYGRRRTDSRNVGRRHDDINAALNPTDGRVENACVPEPVAAETLATLQQTVRPPLLLRLRPLQVSVQPLMSSMWRLIVKTAMTFSAWNTISRWFRKLQSKASLAANSTELAIEKKLSDISSLAADTLDSPQVPLVTPVRKVGLTPKLATEEAMHPVILQALNNTAEVTIECPPGSPTPT